MTGGIWKSRGGVEGRLAKWGKRYPKLYGSVEDHIADTLSFYRLPGQHYKNLKIDQHAGAAHGGKSNAALWWCASFPTGMPPAEPSARS